MFDFRPLLTGEGLISLLSLVALEIVLGIDNIVFIAILSERIDARRRPTLRRTGLGTVGVQGDHGGSSSLPRARRAFSIDDAA